MMKLANTVSSRLDHAQLRKTPFRKLVLLYLIQNKGKAVSSKDIETALDQPDRVTLYRTLKTFEDVGLIHQTVDASGSTKYALCKEGCTSTHHKDNHAHFHCTSCDNTTCIEGKFTNEYSLPNGYKLKETHLILEGLCDRCSKK